MMKRLISVIATVVDVDPREVTVDTIRDDVPTWDSLAVINLAVALESDFSVSLTANDVEQLVSVKSIAEILKRHGVVLEA